MKSTLTYRKLKLGEVFSHLAVNEGITIIPVKKRHTTVPRIKVEFDT